jgi:hypothetical protein
MHEGQEKANRAYDILKAGGLDVGADFQALGASQVEALLAYADQHRLNKYGSMSKYRQSPVNTEVPAGRASSLARSNRHAIDGSVDRCLE